ncbi:sensor histidine kinase [Streptacidiphilus jiangxiensis]|uniref:histidine kinase n=1 Tax=Streptacidiphilus jiangxiensis TaxID=235985 RepID=A0A1H7M022_STRJI|nr:sensor histidine kinase [Streptacidiphilus jiangxiensis]SEL04620.1 Signal transduction histidine kinase [Streptacidiphilus jiangxiensis]
MTEPTTAARRRPRFDARMVRQAAYLLADLPIGITAFALTVPLLSVGVGLLITVVGFWVLFALLLLLRAGSALERARARVLLGEDVPEPAPVQGRRPGFMQLVIATLTDGLAWRSVLYSVIMLPWGIIAFTCTVVSSVVLFPLLPWVVHGLSSVDRALVGSLLSPGRLTERVRELEDDRGAVVDTAAADLRRIERDLHDGAQARLVTLAMDLGLAKEKLTEDPDAAARMVSDAHNEVKLALRELRDLARGIHPAVLTDRGLDAALSSLAARCPLPGGVRVEVELPERPDSAIEGIAYFTVSELLTNAAKHSHAQSASVEIWRSDERLMLQVRDDGVGGAQELPGGGLAGLAERIRAVDGVFVVASPVGGPTDVTAELPWRTRTAAR